LKEKPYEEKIRKALKIMSEISSKARPSKPVNEIIRRFRDGRK
jgi:predicted DNA-binding protein (UPF0278 family)